MYIENTPSNAFMFLDGLVIFQSQSSKWSCETELGFPLTSMGEKYMVSNYGAAWDMGDLTEEGETFFITK